MRSSTYVSYKLTAVVVNAGRVSAPGLAQPRRRIQTVDFAADRRESGPNVGTLFVASVMIFTVAGSVVLGITLAYTSVLALLHAFAARNPAPKPSLVLVHSESHVGAD